MTDIKKIFSKFRFNKNGSFSFGSSPEADWRIILTSFIVLAVFVISLCTFLFIKINSGTIFISKDPLETENTQSFNINRLRQTLEHYKRKGEEFEKARTTPETILDPSL